MMNELKLLMSANNHREMFFDVYVLFVVRCFGLDWFLCVGCVKPHFGHALSTIIKVIITTCIILIITIQMLLGLLIDDFNSPVSKNQFFVSGFGSLKITMV
jgi:hypothetical protein